MRNARRGGPRRRRERGTRGDAPAGPVPEDSGGDAEVTRVPLRGWTPEAKGAEVFNPIDQEIGRRLLATLDVGAGAAQHIKVECASFWGPYHWVTDPDDAAYHMKALWMDLHENPIVGIEVERHCDQVCIVQLASGRRGLVLDVLALQHIMWDLLQPLLWDNQVYKVTHGHFSRLHWLQSELSIVVSPPIIDTAVLAQEHDNMWEDEEPSLQMLCCQYLEYEFYETHKASNWRQRPMPAEMLEYAAIGAQVLLPLCAAIEMVMSSSVWGNA